MRPLFVRLFGFSPVEALLAATTVGGELLARMGPRQPAGHMWPGLKTRVTRAS